MPRLQTSAGRAHVRPPRAAVASAARQRPSVSRAAARRPAAAAPTIPPAAVEHPATAAPLPEAVGSSAGTINISPTELQDLVGGMVRAAMASAPAASPSTLPPAGRCSRLPTLPDHRRRPSCRMQFSELCTDLGPMEIFLKISVKILNN